MTSKFVSKNEELAESIATQCCLRLDIENFKGVHSLFAGEKALTEAVKCAKESAFQTAIIKDKALEVVLCNFEHRYKDNDTIINFINELRQKL